MALLISGLILFIGMHTLPSFTAARGYLVGLLGEMTYKGLFGLISLAGFGLIIAGMSRAELQPLWLAPPWAYRIPYLLMPLSFILVVAAYLPSHIRRLTPHPMLWGVIVWSIAHLPANGNLAAILLFCSMGLFSLFDILSMNRRGKIKAPSDCRWYHDVLVVGIGLTGYLLCLQIHPA